MFKKSVIFLLALCIFAPTLRAKEGSGIWYFAFNQDDGSLAAYNLGGEVHVLMQAGVTGHNVIGTRIRDDEALILLRVDEKFGLYDVTSQSVNLLVGEDGILQVPLAVSEGEAVMINQYAGKPVYASIFKNGTLTQLPSQPIGIRSYARFSQDGRFFRYVGLDANDNFALWNYDTESGENNHVIDFGANPPIVRVDTYGERWLQRTESGDGSASYRTITLDGHVDELGTFDESQIAGAFHMLGNELIGYPEACDPDCIFEARSTDGTQTFQASADTFRGLPVARFADDKLLILGQDDQFYEASPTAPPELIGSFTRNQYHIFGSSFLAVSPDARWLMTVDDGESPTEHQVRSLSTGEVVATYPFSDPPYLQSVDFGDGLIVLTSSTNTFDFLLYDADGGYQIINQPRGEAIRVYFEMLPAQRALYRAAKVGIFMQDIPAGTETPLLQGAWEYISLLKLR